MTAAPRDEAKTLAAAVKEAAARGSLRVETAAGEAWVVVPRIRTTGATPFGPESAGLLSPPVRRAAYSDRTAWLMAELARLAYEPFEERGEAVGPFLEALRQAGMTFENGVTDPETDTQAFVVTLPDRFVALVFRGTEKNFTDIRVDLDARFLKTPAGKAHRGFMEAFESVEPAIRDILRETRPDLPLYVAGHSLGGALASVAAAALDDEFTIGACYSFGSPRVGDAEWSSAIKAPVYRVVNGADGVPLVPLSGLARPILEGLPSFPFLGFLRAPINRLKRAGYVGFQHVGDTRFIRTAGESAQLATGSAAAFARLRHLATSTLVGLIRLNPAKLSGYYQDHSIARYATLLRKIAIARQSLGRS
ncbi:MAG: lipase family protein [Marivibrio sp.]|uniref:lipase family protein n=1 Tax=Marivibrio sp. TaxID=2039719 RepID=UPI0032EBBEA3